MKLPAQKHFLHKLLNRCGDLFFIKSMTPFWRKRLKGKVMIYLYHRIGPEGEHSFLDEGGSPITSHAEFAKDIAFLKQLGATFIRICDINNIDFNDGKFHVVISFDDGFRSNYEDALTFLDQQHIPCTIFQVSSMLEGNDAIWEHQLYFCGLHPQLSPLFWQALQAYEPGLQQGDFGFTRTRISAQNILEAADSVFKAFPAIQNEFVQLTKNLYPSVSQILSAQQRGHEIASHGHSHFYRDAVQKDMFEKDVIQSMKTFEEMGVKPQSYSYPFNRYAADDEAFVSQYYTFVSTVNSGAVDELSKLTALPRNTWPGKAKNKLRHRRWLLTGRL